LEYLNLTTEGIQSADLTLTNGLNGKGLSSLLAPGVVVVVVVVVVVEVVVVVVVRIA